MPGRRRGLDVAGAVVDEDAVVQAVPDAVLEHLEDLGVGLGHLLLARDDDVLEEVEELEPVEGAREELGRPVGQRVERHAGGVQLVQQRHRVVDLPGQRGPEVLPVAADRVLPVRVRGDGGVLGLLPVAARVLRVVPLRERERLVGQEPGGLAPAPPSRRSPGAGPSGSGRCPGRTPRRRRGWAGGRRAARNWPWRHCSQRPGHRLGVRPEFARSGRKVAWRPPPGRPAACTFLACGICSPARSSRPAVCSSSRGLPKLRDPLPLVRALRSAGLPAGGPLVRGWPRPRWPLGVAARARSRPGHRRARGRGLPALHRVRRAGPAPRRRAGVVRLLRPARHPRRPAPTWSSPRPSPPPAAAVARLPAGHRVWSGQAARRRPPLLARVRGACWPPSPTWSSPSCPRPPPPPSAACRRGDSMLAVVVAEGVAIALLAVLVLGLLRSHALILRALHELGAGLELEEAASAPASRHRPARCRCGSSRASCRRPGRRPPSRGADVVGTDPGRRAGAGGGRRRGSAHAAGVPVQRLQRVPDLLGRASSGAVDVPGQGTARRGHPGAGGGERLPAARSSPARGWRSSSPPAPGPTTACPARPTSCTSRTASSPARAPRPPGRRSATSWARPSTTPRRPAAARAATAGRPGRTQRRGRRRDDPPGRP